MPRAKNAVASRNRRKKILKAAKGYRGGKSRLLKTAKEAVERSLLYSYRDRKKKKGDFRKLWIVRINAAVRPHGLSYSKFIHLLSEKDVKIDRKILADLAVTDPLAFSKIVESVK
ncbi:50S ribosomal protein L20 [candidate division KSB1 bacterium]|nr:MAG: 50S ribosomal protein L20 [candidate division KSB1 bacterium]